EHAALSQFDQAALCARHAAALVARLKDVRLEAYLANNLGTLSLQRGDGEAAQHHLERALALKQRLFGPHHPDVAVSLVNLGFALFAQAKYEAALGTFQRAHAIRERLFGETHPDVVSDLDDIAMVLLELGRNDEALAQGRRALAISERV